MRYDDVFTPGVSSNEKQTHHISCIVWMDPTIKMGLIKVLTDTKVKK